MLAAPTLGAGRVSANDGQAGVLIASEIVANERSDQTLELAVASHAPYFILSFAKTRPLVYRPV